MSLYRHTLVIGGTGMLRAASIELAKQSDSMTSIVRTEASLANLDEHISVAGGRHRLIAQDYTQLSGLDRALGESIEVAGPPDLLVAWVHEEDGPVPLALCEAVSTTGVSCRFVQVVGSAAGDPISGGRRLDARVKRIASVPRITYQQVVLGFHLDEATDRSSWLTNAEISSGVLQAIAARKDVAIVGHVRPWDRRP